jgi:hypothetical protein
LMIEEKSKYLDEIDTLKLEINELKAKLNSNNEGLSKEATNKYKEQLVIYKKTINKQLAEIKTLKESIKEMQDTNDFLTQQINNLNEQIFELQNNKENNEQFEVVDKQLATPNQKSTFGSQNENLASSSHKRHLTNSSLINNQQTPSSNNLNKSNALNALSSSVKRQNQCAQQ